MCVYIYMCVYICVYIYVCVYIYSMFLYCQDGGDCLCVVAHGCVCVALLMCFYKCTYLHKCVITTLLRMDVIAEVFWYFN